MFYDPFQVISYILSWNNLIDEKKEKYNHM